MIWDCVYFLITLSNVVTDIFGLPSSLITCSVGWNIRLKPLCKLSRQRVRRLLSTHCYTTMIIPTSNAKVRRLRKAGKPGEKQRAIYNYLAIDCTKLPEKVAIFKKMWTRRYSIFTAKSLIINVLILDLWKLR